MPEIVGASDPATTNESALFAEPLGDVTPMRPVVAPEGTVATSVVELADTTVAPVELKVTVFSDGVSLKPVPQIVTVVPVEPSSGENSRIDTVPAVCREISRRLPTASYEYTAASPDGAITAISRPRSS